jgi:hypothetical protein
VLRTLVFFSLITSAHANLDNLVNAAQSFAAAIDQQITTDQSDPAPTEFAEKTVTYADAKISYYAELRAAMPELTNIATGRDLDLKRWTSFEMHSGSVAEFRR